MAYTEKSDIRIRLDRVERKFITELKAKKPEYRDLDLYQVAKMELKSRLFEEIRKIRGNPGNGLSGIMPRDWKFSEVPEGVVA
jgi:hypothetical protein